MSLRILGSTFLLLLGPVPAQADPPDRKVDPAPAFVENRGQWHDAARFRIGVGPVDGWVTKDGWRLRVQGEGEGSVLGMRFFGTDSEPIGERLRPGRHSWLRGEPSGWVRNAREFGSVRFPSLYPGVDVVLRVQDDHLEYDLLLSPGADLAEIRVRCEGADALRLAEDGALVLDTPAGPLAQDPPLTWIETGGGREIVPCRYVVLGEREFGFAVENWDGSLPLVVDPGLVWSTYLGGSDEDRVHAVDVAANGEAVVTGWTTSSDFPVTTGALQGTYAGPSGLGNVGDAFVARISADGSQFLFVTYLGGNSVDEGWGIDVDPNGEITVGLETRSTDLPTTNDALFAANRGASDAWVGILDSSGSSLLYGSYVGGNNTEELRGLTVDDATGRIYLSGVTRSTNLPVQNAFQSTKQGSLDFFLLALDLQAQPGATTVHYGTYFGASSALIEHPAPHHVDASGVVTMAAIARGAPVPTTPGAYRSARSGISDAFVLRIDPSQSGPAGLVYATYLGGSSTEHTCRAATDSAGLVTIAGTTQSTDFPTTPNAYQSTAGGSQDGFVARLDPTQTGTAQLLHGSYFSGSSGAGGDAIQALAIADGGVAVVAGYTSSRTLPITPGAFQRLREKGGGNTSGFVASFDLSQSGTQSLVYCSALEGCNDIREEVIGMHYDHASRRATLVGFAQADFPLSANAAQSSYGGNRDGFATRIELLPLPASTVAFGAGCQGSNGMPTAVPDLDAQLCNRFRVRFENLRTTTLMVVYFGFSNTSFMGVPLPADLTPFGMPGCRLFVSGDVFFTRTTSSSGTAVFAFDVPGDPFWLDTVFYLQGLVVDLGVNRAGVVATNAIRATVRW